MAKEYIPGIKVTEATIVRKKRVLPIPGEVLVKKGEKVSSNTVIARTYTPGDIHFVNVSNLLKIEPEEVPKCMLKRVGDKVDKGELIAEFKALFGLIKAGCRSPITGTIIDISSSTGQVTIQEPPIPLVVKAYIPGEVVEVLPKAGAIIETPAAFIQGIFGIGGEREGELLMLVKSPDEVLTEEKIKPEHAGKIIVGGALITGKALKKAIKVGVAGIVVGGIRDVDLTNILGYDIGVAITGHEDINTTIIITEGFGKMRMMDRTFNLLKRFEGKKACINGATQIRAGVIRPEIIIPREDLDPNKVKEKMTFTKPLEIGARIRIIREPYFGALGRVISLPEELQEIETTSKVRVVEVELDDGRRVIVPRANVEILT